MPAQKDTTTPTDMTAILSTPQVTLSLPDTLACTGCCAFTLMIGDIPAGVVFARPSKEGGDGKATLSFVWQEVLNPTMLSEGKEGDLLQIALAPLPLSQAERRRRGAAPSLALCTLTRKTLLSLVEPPLTAATDIVVETIRRQRDGRLPATAPVVSSDVTLVAFYLPQFHPTVENDVWWGTGFTEWSKVAAAKPCFKGHKQPLLPGELGFYDLRVPEVMAKQAALAREHGVGAFCFYYYWFGGRRLLEQPLNAFLENAAIEMPFCICWANEPWTRRWDGQETDVLLDQPHSPESDARFILDVIPILKDPRYLRVGGKPLLLVYRAALLSQPKVTTAVWRQLCREQGVGEIELAAVESFNFELPEDFGFDSTVEFPPHGFDGPERMVKPLKDKKPFKGKAWRYADAAAYYSALPPRPWRRFRGVMPGWDNTPRRGRQGYAFVGAKPARYAAWLEDALTDTRKRFDAGERLVFVNAWNEWGEGAVLEPSQRHGRAYLEATRDTLQGQCTWSEQLARLTALDTDETTRKTLAKQLETQIQAYHRTLAFMRRGMAGTFTPANRSERIFTAQEGLPPGVEMGQKVIQARGALDTLGPMGHPEGMPLNRHKPIKIHGWLLKQGDTPEAPPLLFVVLMEMQTKQAFTVRIDTRLSRNDVAEAFGLENLAETKFVGFDGLMDCAALPAGTYSINLLQDAEEGWALFSCPNSLLLE